MSEIRATVRLQFHRGFTLNDAVHLVPYFAQLGISHIYASPLLKASAGSMHGYDVVDPTCINPELGGEEALKLFVKELRNHNMGLLVDFVSNHMAVGGDSNPWWLDVLEWGPLSRYAQFFDIQWNSPDPLLKNQLLMPFLRTDYGEVLAAGEITLHFDRLKGSFYAQHFEHKFPLYPPSYGEILRNTGNNSLLALVHPFEALERSHDIWNATQQLQQELSDIAKEEVAAAAIASALSRYEIAPHNELTQQQDEADKAELSGEYINHDDNIQRLHRLLELQNYRLASWRTAADDINWRRFFDVNELGGLRVEKADVFEATHAKIFELIEAGFIDGLRIDHVDGLANPRAYCRKLRRRLNALAENRRDNLEEDRSGIPHLPIYVEKILGENEQLSSNWNIDGTTGYEFMNQISLLQHDPLGELHLYDLWSKISGRTGTFKEEAREARRLVLSSSLAGDFEMVAQGLLLIARTDIATRDITLGAIRRALLELIVHFPVYRTYARSCGRSEQDQYFFNEALAGARTTLSETDLPLLDHLERWLGGQQLYSMPPGPTRKLRQRVLTRFQQLTSPAAAKAVEDTACYRSAVLLSRNDVGFDPQRFSAPLAQFHQQNIARVAKFPYNLLTTATHDHKRGEDTRARLAVVSERSVWFAEKIQQWQSLANSLSLRTTLDDGVAPSPADELMLYQTLLGTWPLELDLDDEFAVKEYLDRLLRWQEKAVREAKLRSSWSSPNQAYETASRNFLTALMTADETKILRYDIATAAASIAPAGALNSLSQTLLRMSAPGVPDLYQGAEFWDFSLVDPDNRQPVDFDSRIDALSDARTIDELLTQWKNGHIKQWLILQTLGLRSANSSLFTHGDYQPLEVEGEHAERVVTFIRHFQHDNGQHDYLLVVVPRLTSTLLADNPTPHIPPDNWAETRILLPQELAQGCFVSGFSLTSIRSSQNYLLVSDVLADTPVNILYFKHDLENLS